MFFSLKCRRRIPALLRVPKTLHIPFDSPFVVIDYGTRYLSIVAGLSQLQWEGLQYIASHLQR
jgi:hypothetical protein